MQTYKEIYNNQVVQNGKRTFEEEEEIQMPKSDFDSLKRLLYRAQRSIDNLASLANVAAAMFLLRGSVTGIYFA